MCTCMGMHIIIIYLYFIIYWVNRFFLTRIIMSMPVVLLLCNHFHISCICVIVKGFELQISLMLLLIFLGACACWCLSVIK